MMFGNSSSGYGYSPDRSKDVNRFNPSTRANYTQEYNTARYGVYTPRKTESNNTGWYDGAGRYHDK